MKISILLIAVGVALASADAPLFMTLSDEEFSQQYLMAEPELKLEAPNTDDILVENFSLRDDRCTSPVKDQGACGACWAFAIATVANDRYCKATGDNTVSFSEQELLDCFREGSCRGADTPRVAEWVGSNEGFLVKEECSDYITQQQKECPATCSNDFAFNKYESFGSKTFEGSSYSLRDLQDALHDGPVYFSMQVYNDFRNTKAGEVYVQKSKIFSGGHAIRCIGYGTIENAPANAPVEETMYWECINSWGPRFADGGIFKIRMD